MTQLRHAFPTLDAVDHKRRRGKFNVLIVMLGLHDVIPIAKF